MPVDKPMYKLSFYVPENKAEKVKQAMFDAGAGHIGNYDQCCWQTAGLGQFRPLENSTPTLGAQGKLETLPELKIEMVCQEDVIHTAIAAMKQAHPYEEVAYQVVKLVDGL